MEEFGLCESVERCSEIWGSTNFHVECPSVIINQSWAPEKWYTSRLKIYIHTHKGVNKFKKYWVR